MNGTKNNKYSPVNVRRDSMISPSARLLYLELFSKVRYSPKNSTKINNREIADLFNVSPTSASLWVNELNRAGYVTLEYDGKCKHSRRIIHVHHLFNPKTGSAE